LKALPTAVVEIEDDKMLSVTKHSFKDLDYKIIGRADSKTSVLIQKRELTIGDVFSTSRSCFGFLA